MGYLPLYLLEKDIKKIKNWADKEGLEYRQYDFEKCRVLSGSLVVFCHTAVTKLLSKHRGILIKAKVPTQADKFVDYISLKIIDYEEYPEAHIVIGFAFDDERFRGIKEHFSYLVKNYPTIINKIVHREKLSEYESLRLKWVIEKNGGKTF